MKNYLNKINVHNIKEIHFGRGFFKVEIEIVYSRYFGYFYYKIPIMDLINEDVLIHKKNFILPKYYDKSKY